MDDETQRFISELFGSQPDREPSESPDTEGQPAPESTAPSTSDRSVSADTNLPPDTEEAQRQADAAFYSALLAQPKQGNEALARAFNLGETSEQPKPGLPPIEVAQRSEHTSSPAPVDDDDDLGPGWGVSHEVSAGLLFPSLEDER